MTETIAEAEQREAPADTPVGATAPASPDDIDGLIAEYDAAVPPPPKSESAGDAGEQGQDLARDLSEEAAALLRDLDEGVFERHANGRIAELEGRLNSVQDEIHRKAEQEAFDKFAGELQARLPDHLPEDYGRTQLLAMAASNPDLVAAWDFRNHDRRAADMELSRLEALYAEVLRDQRDDPRKAEVISLLEQRGRQFGLINNSPKILQRAIADIERRARQHQPIDEQITGSRETK